MSIKILNDLQLHAFREREREEMHGPIEGSDEMGCLLFCV